MDFTKQESAMLSRLGRSEDGRSFIALLNRMNEHYSSISGIDAAKGDVGSQVEGRKVFVAMAKEIIAQMNSQKKDRTPLDPTDYE